VENAEVNENKEFAPSLEHFRIFYATRLRANNLLIALRCSTRDPRFQLAWQAFSLAPRQRLAVSIRQSGESTELRSDAEIRSLNV
jgi:hypothetical protein